MEGTLYSISPRPQAAFQLPPSTLGVSSLSLSYPFTFSSPLPPLLWIYTRLLQTPHSYFHFWVIFIPPMFIHDVQRERDKKPSAELAPRAVRPPSQSAHAHSVQTNISPFFLKNTCCVYSHEHTNMYVRYMFASH